MIKYLLFYIMSKTYILTTGLLYTESLSRKYMTTKNHVSEKETLLQTKSKNNVTIATYTNLLCFTKSSRT